MSDDLTTRVSTAVELVVRLYVGADDPAQRTLRTRYFGGDFAIGTNLVTLAVERDWTSIGAVVKGVSATDPDDLVHGLLTATTLTTADRDRSLELVDAALTGERSVRAAARELARLSAFAASAVEHVLRDPTRARDELDLLLRGAAATLEPTETATATALGARVAEAAALVAERGREAALLELTGGWTLRDPDQPVVVVPTLVGTPVVITRLLSDGRLLVVCSGPDRSPDGSLAGLAALAHALGSVQRLAILRLVAEEPRTGQGLAEALEVSPATIHHHTSTLRSVGLLTSVRERHSVYHSLDAARLDAGLSGLAAALRRG